MRHILLRTVLGAAVLSMPVAAVAGISLSPIMQSWKHRAHAVDAMLAGRQPYDEARMRQFLQHCIESASLLARDMNGGSAEARDLAARFTAFSDDSRSVLGKAGDRAAAAEKFNRMLSDCQACHALYNN